MRINQDRDRTKGSRLVSPDAVAMNAQSMIHQLALPIEPTDTIKCRIHRATRNSGLSPRKVTKIWYRHACTIAAHEYLTLCAALNRHADTIERAAERNFQLAQKLRGAPVLEEQLAFTIDQEGLPRDLDLAPQRVGRRE